VIRVHFENFTVLLYIIVISWHFSPPSLLFVFGRNKIIVFNIPFPNVTNNMRGDYTGSRHFFKACFERISMTKIEEKSNVQPGIVITLDKIRADRSVFVQFRGILLYENFKILLRSGDL
jgi:hypothetical protein